MNIKDMQQAAQQASELMKSLSSENRLMILCQLGDGEKSVGQLAAALGLRQAAVSQQLALLRKDGLVAPRREAQTIYYDLSGTAARRVIELLYEIYCAPAGQESERLAETVS